MKVHIRFFAAARDAFGSDARDIEISEPSLHSVTAALLADHPGADRLLKACRFAVNMEYVADERVLTEGDEVAVIPPVSGG